MSLRDSEADVNKFTHVIIIGDESPPALRTAAVKG